MNAHVVTLFLCESFLQSDPALASLSALHSATPSWLLMIGSRSAKPPTGTEWYGLGLPKCRLSNEGRP